MNKNKNKRWRNIEVVLLICIVGLGILLKFSVDRTLFRKDYNEFSDRGVARINIILNDTTLEEIKGGTKDIKYKNNEVKVFNDGKVLKYDGVEVKGRGNSTWVQPKKPFQLKFKEGVDLLGLGKARKWVFLANYLDPSFIRNDVTFLLAEMLEEKYNSRGRFVELYFNGEYEGLYYLTHKIEIAKNSVDLKEKDGVLFEIDTLHNDDEESYISYFGSRLVLSDIVSEDKENEESAKKNFTEAFKKLEMAAEVGDYKKVAKLIDVESFAKYYLINEFTVNPDAYSSSFYLYKDGKNDKIHAGPVWDFDLALGNRMWIWQIDEKFFSPKETMIREREAFGKDGLKEDLRISKLFYYLMKMPEFKKMVLEIFEEKMSNNKEKFVVAIYDTIKKIEPSALADQQKWGQDSFMDSARELLKWIIIRYNYFEQEYND